MADMVSREEYEKLLEENKQLKEQLNYLTRKLFGKSSEKADLPDQGQISLFDEDAGVFTEPETTGKQTETVTYTRKKKRTTRQEKIAPEVPIKEIIYTDDEATCKNCQRDLQPIGKSFVREQIRFIPAKLWLERVFKVTYKCPDCEEHQEIYNQSSLYQAAVPNPILAHSLVTPSLIAQVIHNKYELYLPGYRQLQEFKQLGLTVSEPTIINWLNKSAEWFKPIVERLKAELLSQRYLHGDETTCQVLREPNKKANTKSYLWLVCSAKQNSHQIVYFEYQPNRSKKIVQQLFKNYDGHLLCDGYQSYNYLDELAERSGCWAHLRRKFYDAQEGNKSGHSLAKAGFKQIEVIFSSYYHPETQLTKMPIRQLVEQFFNWVHDHEVLNKTKLGKAMTYALNQEIYLKKFLDDDNIALDNNLAERHIKQAVMGRKNWLFSTSQAGAEANAIYLSLVETAKANGLKAKRYFEYLLEKLPQLPTFPTTEQLAVYLPWSKAVQANCR